MDVQEGCILVGGQDISRLRQADLRSLIAYVPQDPAMFHRTLRDNIAFARPGASDAEIHRAAQAAHVTEFAEVLPDGFDTMVGERGIKLSGGQRQRVALARAILRDAPILLLTRQPARWTRKARSSSNNLCGSSWTAGPRSWWLIG
jgi:ATP-binding cassette subfamily B protein